MPPLYQYAQQSAGPPGPPGLLECPDVGGSVVVSWGASRARSLSNQPFPQVTRPVPGVSPAGLRYSALGTRQGTLARHNPVTRSAGTRQDKPHHWCRGPYIQWGPYCIDNRIYRTSNRIVLISMIRPQIWRATRPSAELRCLQADNRTGSFDTLRYCSDFRQFPVYTAMTYKPFV